MENYLNILRKKGFKITPLRKRILHVFQEGHQTLTAEKLCKLIRRQIPQAGLQSIYRNMADFVKVGIAEEIFQRRKLAYALCCDVSDHHHHMVCNKCGHSDEIKSCGLDSVSKSVNKSFQTLQKKTGFRIQRHFLQLEGLCRDCQK